METEMGTGMEEIINKEEGTGMEQMDIQ